MGEKNKEQTNFLEKGDFFPFIRIGGREIHNLVDNRYTLIFNTKQKIKLFTKYQTSCR